MGARGDKKAKTTPPKETKSIWLQRYRFRAAHGNKTNGEESREHTCTSSNSTKLMTQREIQKVSRGVRSGGGADLFGSNRGNIRSSGGGKGGGVNHLQGDEEFTSHSASPLTQKDLDGNGIRLVKPRVLTNRKPRRHTSGAEGRGSVCADTGEARGAWGDHREIEHASRVGKRVAGSADPQPGGTNALLTFCRRLHGDWQRGRGDDDKAVKWKSYISKGWPM